MMTITFNSTIIVLSKCVSGNLQVFELGFLTLRERGIAMQSR